MKSKVFFYLFLFSILIVALLYVNNKNMTLAADKRIENAHKRIEIVRDSLREFKKISKLDNYFALENNEDAQEYFNYQTVDADIESLKEEILALNHQENGNPLVPYGAINGDKCIINKIKVLNHRWIIADFYAGSVHGEVLIKYFHSKDKSKPTEFSTIETVLYPTN